MTTMMMTNTQLRLPRCARSNRQAVLKPAKHWAAIAYAVFILTFPAGCVHTKAHYQTKTGKGPRYSIDRATIHDDTLLVDGSVNSGGNGGIYGFGVEVVKAEDEHGNRLNLKYARVFLQKGFVFQLKFDAPVKRATQFDYELILISHHEQQRLEGNMNIKRSPQCCQKLQHAEPPSCTSMTRRAEQTPSPESGSE